MDIFRKESAWTNGWEMDVWLLLILVKCHTIVQSPLSRDLGLLQVFHRSPAPRGVSITHCQQDILAVSLHCSETDPSLNYAVTKLHRPVVHCSIATLFANELQQP